jgi:hypothetical protein
MEVLLLTRAEEEEEEKGLSLRGQLKLGRLKLKLLPLRRNFMKSKSTPSRIPTAAVDPSAMPTAEPRLSTDASGRVSMPFTPSELLITAAVDSRLPALPVGVANVGKGSRVTNEDGAAASG